MWMASLATIGSEVGGADRHTDIAHTCMHTCIHTCVHTAHCKMCTNAHSSVVGTDVENKILPHQTAIGQHEALQGRRGSGPNDLPGGRG